MTNKPRGECCADVPSHSHSHARERASTTRKIEFHESGDRAPTDFFPPLPPRFFFPLGPTDCVCFFSRCRRYSSSSLFAFSIALTPLLLSTALLTSKWGDPFWRRLLTPDSLLGAACCSQLDSVRPSIPTGTAHYRVRSKSVRRLFLFFFFAPFSARDTHSLPVTVSLW